MTRHTPARAKIFSRRTLFMNPPTTHDPTLHVKRLTPRNKFFRHHVHLDTRSAVGPEGSEVLLKAGFSRSHISVNCFSYAQGSTPNAVFAEKMFDESEPETWTVKTDNALEVRESFRRARQVMKRFKLEGYLESETVHSDRPILSASKPFNRKLFEKLCPLAASSGPLETTFRDAEGKHRHLPFSVNLKNLDARRGERAPVLEFHLSLNYDMLEDLNLACLLNGMGLVSYEIPKICADADGRTILRPDGSPLIIRERPLTLRLANPGASSLEKADWKRSCREFLRAARYFRELVCDLGGFAAPYSFSGGELLYPVTFKLESLSGFYSQVADCSKLPPVFDGIVPGRTFSAVESEASLLALRDRLEREWAAPFPET